MRLRIILDSTPLRVLFNRQVNLPTVPNKRRVRLCVLRLERLVPVSRHAVVGVGLDEDFEFVHGHVESEGFVSPFGAEHAVGGDVVAGCGGGVEGYAGVVVTATTATSAPTATATAAATATATSPSARRGVVLTLQVRHPCEVPPYLACRAGGREGRLSLPLPLALPLTLPHPLRLQWPQSLPLPQPLPQTQPLPLHMTVPRARHQTLLALRLRLCLCLCHHRHSHSLGLALRLRLRRPHHTPTRPPTYTPATHPHPHRRMLLMHVVDTRVVHAGWGWARFA
jgi:hypothetical protein